VNNTEVSPKAVNSHITSYFSNLSHFCSLYQIASVLHCFPNLEISCWPTGLLQGNDTAFPKIGYAVAILSRTVDVMPLFPPLDLGAQQFSIDDLVSLFLFAAFFSLATSLSAAGLLPFAELQAVEFL
jgi:hypothetical protein